MIMLQTRAETGWRALTCALALALAGVIAAAEASDSVQFDITAQPLVAALKVFAEQSNMQLLYQHEAVDGATANPVVGTFDKRNALEQLLRGTGLEVVFTADDAATIRPKGKGTPATRTSAGRLNTLQLAGIEQSEDRAAAQRSADSKDQSGDSAAREGTGKSEGVQEVIVTATKRAENIQDVPISISVVTAEDIERRGLVHSGDYLRGMPAVNQMDGGPAGQAIVMRGLETNTSFQNFYSGATTATYFGETPTTNSAGLNASSVDIKLVDIERVEVLRGPQGTAFGGSAMGGAVRVIPAAPKVDRLEGRVGAGYSVTSGFGDDNYTFQAIANVPLVKDRLAIRGVAYSFSESGYYRNNAGSDAAYRASFVVPFGLEAYATDEDNVGAYRVTGGRLSALFQATEKLRLTLSYLSQQTETDGYPVGTTGAFEQTMVRVLPRHVRRGEPGGVADYGVDIANGVLEYDFGWANLLATYSYVKGDAQVTHSYGPNGAFNIPWAASTGRFFDHREDVGEIRLASKLSGALNFLVGLYAEKQDDGYFNDLYWQGDLATNFFAPGESWLYDVHDNRVLEQQAAFGEVSWKFLERFTLTGGMRAYKYSRDFRQSATGPLFGAGSLTLIKADASGQTFRANLSYKPVESAMFYAGWAQGFRPGKPLGTPPSNCDADGDGIFDGTSLSIASAQRVASDAVDSYELGAKFSAADRRLTVDAALFRMDWSDIPVAGFVEACSWNYVANAGTARSEGLELQASWRISPAFQADFGGSYVDARLTRDVPTEGFKAGDRLPGGPRVNANVGLQHNFTIAGRESLIRADAIYVGPFHGGVLALDNTEAGDYVKLDATARVVIDHLNLDLYVRNLTDEDAFTYRPVADYGRFYGYRLRPRTIGFQLGYAF